MRLSLRGMNMSLSALDEVIARKKADESSLYWNVVSLFSLEKVKSNTLLDIYKVLDLEHFIQLLYAAGGKEVKFPTKQELEENLLAALLYIERELNGLSWEQVKMKYPTLEISSIKYAVKIKNLNDFVRLQLEQIANAHKAMGGN